MEIVREILSRAVQELLGRWSGPLHSRLIIQPILALLLATRAGLRDAREGSPAFLWTVFTDRSSRARFLQSGWKDISKIFVMAMALDGVYQAIVFRRFFVLQALVVAVAVAVIPYALARGPVSRLAGGIRARRGHGARHAGAAGQGGST